MFPPPARSGFFVRPVPAGILWACPKQTTPRNVRVRCSRMILRAGSSALSPVGSCCTIGSAWSRASGFSSSFGRRMNPSRSSRGRLVGGISGGSSVGRNPLGGRFGVESKLTFEVSINQRGCALRFVSAGSNVVQVRQPVGRNAKFAFISGIPRAGKTAHREDSQC